MSKYMEFKETEEGKIQVINKKDDSLLGEIVYYSPWRQSVFAPIEGVVFNDECLMDIIFQVKGQTANRKNRPFFGK